MNDGEDVQSHGDGRLVLHSQPDGEVSWLMLGSMMKVISTLKGASLRGGRCRILKSS